MCLYNAILKDMRGQATASCAGSPDQGSNSTVWSLCQHLMAYDLNPPPQWGLTVTCFGEKRDRTTLQGIQVWQRSTGPPPQQWETRQPSYASIWVPSYTGHCIYNRVWKEMRRVVLIPGLKPLWKSKENKAHLCKCNARCIPAIPGAWTHQIPDFICFKTRSRHGDLERRNCLAEEVMGSRDAFLPSCWMVHE